MTHEPEHHRNETDLQGLLRSVDLDAPTPDLAALNALRQRAADEFARAAAVEGSAPLAAVSPVDSTPTIPKDRRSSMLALAIRGSLALSAAVALLAVWLNPFAPQVAGGSIPFSKVMEELRSASTLHLQLQRGGQTSEILVRVPGLVRKQDSPQRYQIAAGSRWWKIDEAENTVSEGDSPWFLSPDKQIDLLRLLEVGVKDATPLLVARPYQRTTYGGRDCYAYRVDLPGEQGRVHVEAFADVTNNQLVGITARDVVGEKGVKQPVAELRLVAVNQPVADEQFAVSKSLTEDGRIGKVSEAQGIVVLRPMLAKRWTPVCRETLLRPGDWLRTELRGANAVKITLASEVELTLGPGSLIECISTTQARLHNGQVQVKVGGKPVADGQPDSRAEFTLLAPRTGDRGFKAGTKQLVRVDREEKLVDMGQTPVWLAGFEGTTSNESLGSLIVNLPDGRNEPLTVGYHKVSVEIRDQIARTTIEESFVNHTPTRLEGVFHFPLPQDASISGFGMWIGNDLVEADVVEKQRAREIFETILREKRDPGLLEWMGGNIFKARVFPIEAHSEKRIKVVYTQVLPLRANRYRYSYGLRSELLRTKPLRELSLNVTVNSAIPLKGVSCPTHTVRTQQTRHSAQVEFTAQEYTPTRDFEVVCEVDGKQSDVVVIPHRRGNDGYFLLQLTPPGPEGNWQRELLPDGKSLNVVLLCDTSSSMDSEKRRQQAEFVSAVLMSLGSDDHFQMACADVGTAWMSAEPLPVNAENAAKARGFLDERISLGWTNLDRAFADVIQKSPADAQVLYVGDGIVSAGSTDPAAFVQRLKQLITKAEKPASGARRVFHSISVGNSHEAVVLKGIASTTGGSSRAITNEQTPQIIALELLNEIAQPVLRDLNIEFRGLKVAAVYPEQLPNVAAGTQQILVGRYLPEGKDQSGEIVITGMRGNEKVKYATQVNLKDAEAGNSFIPRLWARGHLDQLLAQGQSSQIKDEIIGLSEEFHIITPYTSLLVLESDADRERFGVKRRYEMRDGEKFFAEGRSNANFELLQAQMKRAGDWRLGLRRQILLGLNDLGRNPQLLQQQLQQAKNPYFRSGGWYENGPMGAPMSYSGSMGGMGGGMGFGDAMDFVSSGNFLGDQPMEFFATKSDDFGVVKDMKDAEDLSLAVAEPQSADRDDDSKSLSDGTVIDGRMDFQDGFADAISVNGQLSNGRGFAIGGKRKAVDARKRAELGKWAFDPYGDRSQGSRFGRYATLGYQGPDYTNWLNSLFPTLEARPLNRPAVRPAEAWSAEAIELSKSLSRTEALRKFEGGIEFKRVIDQLDPIWNRLSSRHRDLVLYSPSGWLTMPLNPDQQTVVHYCTGRERGTYSSAFLLGRQRPAVDTDFGPEAMGLYDGSVFPLHEQFRDRIARVEPAGQDRVKLILTTKDSTFAEHLLIDTAKHGLIKHDWFDGERLTSSETRDDFVEVAGSWWPQKVSHLDDAGRKTSETTFDVHGLPRPRFTERLDQELAARAAVQFIHLPFVKLSVARQKVADGTAAFDDELAMILHAAQSQQWEQLWKYVDLMEKQAVNKPGLRWIRTMLLLTIRRNEEARDRLLAEAKELVAGPQPEVLFFTGFILGKAQSVCSTAELLEFVQLLKPVYERQPAELDAMLQWTGWMATCQEGLGNYEQVLALKKSIAEQGPWNPHWQTDYAQRLSQAGQFDAAHAWLQKELARPIKRRQEDDEVLRSVVADLYRTQTRWNDLLKFTTEWIALKPTTHPYNSAYAQHLSALVFNDRVDDAYATAQQWMNESEVEGKLTADQQIRLDVAVNFALGSAYNLSYQRMEERWNQPLGKLVRYYVKHATQLDIASRIFTHYQFQQSDIADQLRGDFFAVLQADVATLPPNLINNLVGWTMSGRMEAPVPILGRKQLDASEIPTALWKEIAASLRSRWEKSQTKFEKQQLSEALNSIYSNRFRDDLLLPFLQERIASAPADLKQSYISSLFEALLVAEWTDAIEREAFDRLKDLSDAPDANDRLIVEIPALYRLVDSMLANRQRVGERKLTDEGGLDKLTRKELAAKKQDIQRTSRVELAARLQQQAGQTDGPLANWLTIERTWIEVKLGQNLLAVAETCWKFLGDAPPKPVNHDNDVDDAVVAIIEQSPPAVDPKENARLLESSLKQRALTTVIKLALLKSTKPDDIARIMKFIDIGIEQGRAAAVKPAEEDAKPAAAAAAAAAVVVNEVSRTWRNAKFRVLIALDRADELEKELRAWIRDDISTGPWRQSLARLLAERGKLDEAIQLFEACQKDNLLSASDFKQLADWYLVTDRRDRYERSRIESYKVMPEWQLNQLVYQLAHRWEQQNATLTALDDETL
ncbi:MAG TPA: VIT domain-containing protein, partial [Schlesneria sp.]